MTTTPTSASPGEAAGAWDARFTPGRFAVILAALICAAYPDVVFGNNTFVFRDFGLFGYPLAHYHRQTFWQGEVPLWNPLNGCGLPFLAQWNSLVLYPGSLFYLLFPLAWSLAMYCLLHLFMAGLSMYLLAYFWTGQRLAACVAGMAFSLNGLSLNCLMWPNNVAALAWMPLVVLCAERAWRKGGRRVASAAVVGGIQMLTGAPEIILFTWLILGALALVHLARGGLPRRTLILRFGLVAVLVAALAAMQLLPFLDLLSFSQRHRDFEHTAWSMPGTGWANLLVPLFYCYQGRSGVYFQLGQVWTSSYYLGAGILALALSALFQAREWRVRFLGAVAGIGLVLALGDNGYLYTWFRKLFPAAGYMRYPIKLVVLAAFALPLLAGFAVARFQRTTTAEGIRFRRTVLTLGIVIAALIAALMVFAYCSPGPMTGWEATWKSGASRMLLCWLILGLWLATNRIRRTQKRVICAFAMLAIIGLDALTHAPRQNPTISRAAFQPNMVKLEPRPHHGESRAMMSLAAQEQFGFKFTSSPLNDYLVTRAGLFSNANLLENIPEVSGFYSLYLREAEVIRHSLYHPKDGKDLSNLLDFLGVSQVSQPGKPFEFERRDTWLPMATIGQKPFFADAETSAQTVANGEFNPREVVLLPRDAESMVVVTNRTKASILRSRFTAHRDVIEVRAEEPSLLVMAQALYPRWRAYVDGRRVPGLRANHAYQAVQVPAGQHTVELVYHDASFHAGVIVSLLSLAGCVAVWRCQRQRASPAILR